MARLSLLTRAEAVDAALDEFRRLGRQAFLDRYGFGESRDYFVRIGNELFDTKPIVAAAFGNQLPELGALGPGDFRGGMRGAVRALENLGYEVVSPVQLRAPRIGDEYKSRSDVQRALGGAHVQGIIRFPGEAIVNAFSDEEGPYADEPPSPSDDFGYRGEGLVGPERLDSPGNGLLEEARLTGAPVRFWYRRQGHSFRFWCWVAVIGRAWVVGTDTKGELRRELEWRFLTVPGPNSEEWAPEVVEAQRMAGAADDPDDEPAAQIGASYSALCKRVGPAQPALRVQTDSRWNFQRGATARRAVLQRSDGRCENPACTGMPSGLSRSGHPILEVDHVNDLGRGGDDHPENMIALCPNCHAVKTRGMNASGLRISLKTIAARLHAEALARAVER